MPDVFTTDATRRRGRNASTPDTTAAGLSTSRGVSPRR